MAKIEIANQQLPVSASVKYRSTDEKDVTQVVAKKSTVKSTKDVSPGSIIKVTVGAGASKEIKYETGNKTLLILQEGGQNNFGLKWG
ncbi:MAG: hypothetical protein ABJA78_00800 [Ferruginibacter sp.]